MDPIIIIVAFGVVSAAVASARQWTARDRPKMEHPTRTYADVVRGQSAADVKSAT